MAAQRNTPAPLAGGNRGGGFPKRDAEKYTNRGINFQRVNSAALARLPELLARWLPDGQRHGHEFVAKNPRRADTKAGSFSISLTTGRWGDFATGDKGGDVISLAAYLGNVPQVEAARRISDMLEVR
jgi:hypothetical protein